MTQERWWTNGQAPNTSDDGWLRPKKQRWWGTGQPVPWRDRERAGPDLCGCTGTTWFEPTMRCVACGKQIPDSKLKNYR